MNTAEFFLGEYAYSFSNDDFFNVSSLGTVGLVGGVSENVLVDAFLCSL